MNIINLTPHDIVVQTTKGTITFPKSENVARLSVTENVIGEINGIPVISNQYGEVEGVPEVENTKFIVSSMVLDNLKDPSNFMAPDTGKSAIRNDQGHIVAVTRFRIR